MTASTRSPLAGRRAVVVNWRDPWHSLAGGSERYAWEFARSLHAAGARVEFLTAREPGQHAAELRDGIEIRRAGGPFTFYAHAALRLLRRRRRLDIVIDPECGIPTFSPLFVRRDTAVVLVLHHVHQEQFRTYFPAPLAWLGRTLERVVMPRVYRRRATVAVSQSTRREMRTQLGWDGPIGILGNGARAAADHDGLAEAKDPDRLVVLGRLVPHKRVDLVLQTLHALREERPEPAPRRVRPGSGPGQAGGADRPARPRWPGHLPRLPQRGGQGGSAAPGRSARVRLRYRGLGSGCHRCGGVRRADRRPQRPGAPGLGARRIHRLAGARRD